MVGAILLIACQTPRDDRPKASAEKPSSESRRVGNWERTRECAAQAERAAKSSLWDARNVLGWENHYSPKYERCFVVVSWPERNGSKEELYDAFERRNLATCAVGIGVSHVAEAADETKTSIVDTSVCQDFIRDRMAR
jgi:hypothetical protein